MPTGHYLTREQIDYIRKHFADTPNKELARELGISSSGVTNIQRKYNLRKSLDHLKAMHRLSGLASVNSDWKLESTPEIVAKRAASFKKRFKTEKARIAFGLPQKTKIRIRKCPRAKVRQNYYLRTRGYIIDESIQTAYYTEETRRATRLEKGIYKSYYTFKSYEDEKRGNTIKGE